MMIRNFNDILAKAKSKEITSMVIPNPQSKRVLTAIYKAKAYGLIEPIIIGDRHSIEENISLFLDKHTDGYKIIDEPDSSQALSGAIKMLDDQEAKMIFQGDINIKEFLKAITDERHGITKASSLSYVSLFELPSEDRTILFTDTCINESPELKQKVNILANAVSLANSMGIEKPKVAALSMVELVNPDFRSTTDAAILSKMSERRQINAIIDGPLDIDCASSFERAKRKGLNSPVSGDVDIYFLPDIESGYSIVEVLTFLGGAKTAGALMGSKIPIILNLRFEPTDSILINIALATLRYQ